MWSCIVDHGTPTSINCFSHIYYTWNKKDSWKMCGWSKMKQLHILASVCTIFLLDLSLLFTNTSHAITVAAMQLWSFHIGLYYVWYYQWIIGWCRQYHSDKLHGAVEHAVTTIMPKILQYKPYRIWQHIKLCWERESTDTDPLDVWRGFHRTVKLSRGMATPWPLCIVSKFHY
jgi:hypothetical protein